MHGVRNGSENVFAASKSTDLAADRSEIMQACSSLEPASAHVDVALFYPTRARWLYWDSWYLIHSKICSHSWPLDVRVPSLSLSARYQPTASALLMAQDINDFGLETGEGLGDL